MPDPSTNEASGADPLDPASLGSASDAHRFLEILYPELHRLAAALLRSERRDHTLQATALLHEAYLRLEGNLPGGVKDRQHFFALAARAMRRILIDHARGKLAHAHGGGAQVFRLSLAEGEAAGEKDALELVALDTALKKLAEIDPDSERIVTLRYFAGLSEVETAAALGLGLRTVQKYWQWARAWLAAEMGEGGGGGHDGRARPAGGD